jgi:PEP-CTERM motif-containing protein
MNRIGVTSPHAVDRAAARGWGFDVKRPRRPGLRRHAPLGVLGLLWAAVAVCWAAPPAGAAALSARTESCSHGFSAPPIIEPFCVFDNETGVDTPVGPLAAASITDPFKDAGVNPIHPYNYLGQATAQAGFGHVGTFAEVQVENATPVLMETVDPFTGFTIRAGGASAEAESRDTLTFSGGATVRFGFTLAGPAVAVCAGPVGGGGPCDEKLGSARSNFGATFSAAGGAPGVFIERDDIGGVPSTNIGPFGTLNPLTDVLLSDPVSIIDPVTGHRVPVDLVMDSSSSAGSGDSDPEAAVLTTTAVANFLDTATLTEVLVFDTDGNLIPDVTITAASGAVYPLAATGPSPPPSPPPPGSVAVPEPPALALISLGFGTIGCAAWRRRVRA